MHLEWRARQSKGHQRMIRTVQECLVWLLGVGLGLLVGSMTIASRVNPAPCPPCLGPPCLRPAARTQPSLCPHLPSPALTYPHLPSPPSPTRPQALHNLVMYATDLALHPGGTEGVAYVGTAFATYTGLNVLIVLLAALLTLWAPSAGRWIDT